MVPMNAHTTPGEQACVQQITPEYEQLHEHWNSWCQTANMGDNPLALDAMITGFVAELRDRANADHPVDPHAALHAFLKSLLDLCAWMFRFGQYTMQQQKPLLFEDLTICHCGQLTEEDVSKLLETPLS